MLWRLQRNVTKQTEQSGDVFKLSMRSSFGRFLFVFFLSDLVPVTFTRPFSSSNFRKYFARKSHRFALCLSRSSNNTTISTIINFKKRQQNAQYSTLADIALDKALRRRLLSVLGRPRRPMGRNRKNQDEFIISMKNATVFSENGAFLQTKFSCELQRPIIKDR